MRIKWAEQLSVHTCTCTCTPRHTHIQTNLHAHSLLMVRGYYQVKIVKRRSGSEPFLLCACVWVHVGGSAMSTIPQWLLQKQFWNGEKIKIIKCNGNMSSFQPHLVLSHFNRNPVDSDRKQNHCNISVPALFHCLLCVRIHSSVLGHPSNVPPDPAHPWAPEVITCCCSIPLPPPTLLYGLSHADIVKILGMI